MTSEKDDGDRAVDLLIRYQIELSAEIPVLNRYTDVISRPDHLGGYSERERDRAWRKCLMCPTDTTTTDACIGVLTDFKNAQSCFADLQDALCLIDQAGVADALARRRTRRRSDIDRMIEAAESLKDAIRKADEKAASFADSVGAGYDIIKSLKDALTEPPTFDVSPDRQHVQPTEPDTIDYRVWEDSATVFNRGIADDIDFIEKFVKARISAIVEAYNVNVRNKSADTPNYIRAGGEIGLPDTWGDMSATAQMRWVSDYVKAVPHADAERMTAIEILDAIKNRIVIDGKVDTLIALTNAGFKMVLDNQPLTFKAAKEYGASLSQQTRAKAQKKAGLQRQAASP